MKKSTKPKGPAENPKDNPSSPEHQLPGTLSKRCQAIITDDPKAEFPKWRECRQPTSFAIPLGENRWMAICGACDELRKRNGIGGTVAAQIAINSGAKFIE